MSKIKIKDDSTAVVCFEGVLFASWEAFVENIEVHGCEKTQCVYSILVLVYK